VAGGERQGRQLSAQHLGGQFHGLAAAKAFDAVAVDVAGDEHLGEQGRHRGAVVDGLIAQRPCGDDLEDSHAFTAVEQRHPEVGAARLLGAGRSDHAEGPPGQCAVDGDGFALWRGPAEQRDQHALVVVHHEDDQGVRVQQRGGLHDHVRQVLRAALMRLA
jgi:hypothetical protein